ncbi:MAG: sigma 54-interacting transcriptional regulator [Myxococcota bacterium]
MPTSLASGYVLRGVLGEGASASVWLAHDRRGREVALKVVAVAAGPEAATQLRVEFELLGRVRHPALVCVHDLFRAGDDDAPLPAGSLVLVEEALRGEDPRRRFEALDGAARSEEALGLLRTVAGALGALHEHGFVHGDVKAAHLLYAERGPVLCDLGLARRGGFADGAAAGTPAMMAPEVIAGAPADPRADLWSLGATIYHLCEGRLPFAGEGLALLRAILEEPPAKPSRMGEGLACLVLRLLEKDPAARYGSARAVEAQAARLCGDPAGAAALAAGGRLREGPLIGRESEVARLGARLREIAQRRPRAGVVWLAGAAGCGKSRVWAEALRRHRLAAAAGREPAIALGAGSSLAEALRALGVAPPEPVLPDEAASALALRLVDAIAKVAPAVLCVEDAAADRALLRALAGALARDPEAPPLLVVAETREPHVELDGEPLGGEAITLPPLGDADAAALVRAMADGAPAEFAKGAVAAAAGCAGMLCELVRESWRETGGRLHYVAQAPSIDALRRLRVANLGGEARVAEALAVMQDAATAAEVARVIERDEPRALGRLRALVAEGLAVEAAGAFRLRDASWAAPIEESLGPARARRLHARALGRGRELDGATRARHLLVARPTVATARLALAAAEEERRRGARGRARHLLAGALDLGDPRTRRRARLGLAELDAHEARYDAALAWLSREKGEATALARARILVRAGRYADAEGALGSTTSTAARAQRARICLARGDFAGAHALAGGGETGELREAAGLADLYLGRAADARARFEVESRSAGEPASRARVLALVGMAAQLGGDAAAAHAAYKEALELARRAGDVHGAAVYAANLGAAEADRGFFAPALELLAAAVRDLARLGQTAEWAYAIYNHGALLERLGDAEGARRLAARAAEAGSRAGAALLRGFSALLAGDLAARQGELASAEDAYRCADAAFSEQGAERERAQVDLRRAAAARRSGAYAEAAALLVRAAREVSLADRIAIESARLALASGEAGPEAARSLVEARRRLEAGGLRDEAWRADLLSARLLARQGEREEARAALERARNTWKEIVMATPEIYRQGLEQDPDARWLREADGAEAPSPVGRGEAPAPAARAADGVSPEARLRRLLAINKRLNSELSLPRLLEYIVDTVVDLCAAERGFILLVDEAGAMEVKVARNIARSDLAVAAGAQPTVSRSIAERAIREGQPVVTIDAAEDARFEAARSVASLRLRSVLAVPLHVKGKAVGALYVDHRLRRGAFSDGEVALVLDFCDQAAIAIENAHMHRQLRRQAVKLERNARELERRVQGQEVEILAMREEVGRSREALGGRSRYGDLVGRSPRILDVFRLLDRVVVTDLPVVVIGESGTGKELVARALHHGGARKDGPFVSENCSAIPETLLESVLFGHVRGAFTGADRDRRGLFEIAHGGTLFLDEVGETSPGMQSKLLRVLQEKEFRRVGGERSVSVDVRVIAASNRDLAKLVQTGRFREDLYYRLSVVRVDLPPLRERRDDIPALVEHFVAKHFPGRGLRVERDAMARLVGYAWPGNVRELENQVLRAAAMAGDAQAITIADLSPAVAAGAPLTIDPDDLRLRSRVDALERDLIGRALGRTEGNQSRAAILLGLSRYGLQKKLKRIGNRVAPSRQR